MFPNLSWSFSKRGRNSWWNKGKPSWVKGKKWPEEVRRKNSEAHKGVKSYLWKGGISKENKLIRESIDYKLWRETVFKRDDYTCVWCGDKTGGNLNADHIKPFALFPELRFAIDNGRTLCVPCHKETKSYLNPHMKSYQFSQEP